MKRYNDEEVRRILELAAREPAKPNPEPASRALTLTATPAEPASLSSGEHSAEPELPVEAP